MKASLLKLTKGTTSPKVHYAGFRFLYTPSIEEFKFIKQLQFARALKQDPIR